MREAVATGGRALHTDIQVLRGWAVLLVVLGHAELLPQDCRVQADGVPLYRDAGHLSHAGSRWLGEAMHLPELVLSTAR